MKCHFFLPLLALLTAFPAAAPAEDASDQPKLERAFHILHDGNGDPIPLAQVKVEDADWIIANVMPICLANHKAVYAENKRSEGAYLMVDTAISIRISRSADVTEKIRCARLGVQLAAACLSDEGHQFARGDYIMYRTVLNRYGDIPKDATAVIMGGHLVDAPGTVLRDEKGELYLHPQFARGITTDVIPAVRSLRDPRSNVQYLSLKSIPTKIMSVADDLADAKVLILDVPHVRKEALSAQHKGR